MSSSGDARTHLIHQGPHEGLGAVLAEEAVRVVHEDLEHAVQHVVQQQGALRHAVLRVEQRLVCSRERGQPRYLI